MKKIISILAFIAVSLSVNAQTFTAKTYPTGGNSPSNATRGTYGTWLPISSITGNIYTIVSGTVTAMPSTRAADTLVSPPTAYTGYKTDTGYVQFSTSNLLNKVYDLYVTTISGTLAGAAVLQGSFDGQNWYTLTGNTTTCASCIGASASLSGTGTTHYQWSLPGNSGDIYPYHQVRAITSGTCTATFSAKQNTAY